MILDALIFQRQFDQFERQILRESGQRFVSFYEGLPDDWEYYKEPLRSIARDRLGFVSWQSADVGKAPFLNN